MRLPVIQSARPGQDSCGCGQAAPDRRGMTRRGFLGASAAAGGGLFALGAAVSPLAQLADADENTFANFLQKHYKEMSPEEMTKVLARIRSDVQRKYGLDANVTDPKPLPDTEFAYAINLSVCNGSRRCVHACVKENNQSHSPELQYIRVLEMPKGTLDLEQGNHHYDHETVPDRDFFYLPVQCHQCADPPCVKVCPVEATWQEPDGITVIDYDWCIGCRYCQAACPYWARRFNFTEPEIPVEELNTDEMGYLSNRPRPKGVMEKCTFCLHRTRRGELPACLEACPTGARKFGNLLDPESEVSKILQTKRVFVLKEEAGTLPRFFYYFNERTTSLAAPEPMEEDGGDS